MANVTADPSLVDNGGIVGVPGTEKHPRGKDTSAGSTKSKGGRPSKQPDALKHKPGGAAEIDPHKLRQQRATEYDKKAKAKPTSGKDIKAEAREVRRRERFIEKGY